MNNENELTAALATIEKCREITNCPAGVDLHGWLKQLAAENVGLKAAISAVNMTAEECELNGDELKFVVEPSEFWVLIDLLDETPATDRIVAGIKADGVEEFAAHLRANYNGASVCKIIALGADDFAKQLREGGKV